MAKRRGPRGEQLPDGISYDPAKKRFRVYGKHGGKTLAEARRKKREIDREARGVSPRTHTAYFDRWAAHKARQGRRNVDKERSNLERHVEPTLGHRHLMDVRPKDILDLWWELYGERILGAKSIHNVHGSLSSVYSLAQFEELIDINPCKQIPRGEMPKVGDNPWPKFEPEEVAILTADERIRLDRRVLYSLFFFFADREGEGCGFTFEDYDRTCKPLGSIVIDKQYQGEPLKGSRDDYVAVRRFPVHPEAARIIAEWKLSGFASIFGRPPRDSDPIVPNPATMQARQPNAVYKALIQDEKRVGIEHKKGRATHGFRKAWISMARAAGGNPDVIRALTHNGRSRDILDLYTQWPWETFCATAQLVQLPSTAQVIAFGGRHA